MTTDAKETRGDRVRAHLLAKYPCAILPFGVVTEIAEQFGVTRERVRQIAVGLGYPGYMSQTKDQRIIRSKMGRTLCPTCGKPMGRGRYAENRVSRYRCQDCRWIEVACSECGKLKRVHASEYLSKVSRGRTNYGKYTGAQFCDRVCFGRYMGERVGFAAHPENTGGNKEMAWRSSATRKAATRAKIVSVMTRPMTIAEITDAMGLRKSRALPIHLKEMLKEQVVTCAIGSGTGSPRIWSLVEREGVES